MIVYMLSETSYLTPLRPEAIDERDPQATARRRSSPSCRSGCWRRTRSI